MVRVSSPPVVVHISLLIILVYLFHLRIVSNRAAAYSNNNQSVLLNMLSSEFIIIDNPFGDNTEPVTGIFLLNQKYGLF